MKKIIVVLVTAIMCLNTLTAFANDKKNIYNEDGKIKLKPTWYELKEETIHAAMNEIDNAIPKLSFWGEDTRPVTGTIAYPNYNDIAVGDFDLQWVFTPDDGKYETKTGVFHMYIWPEETEEQKGKMPEQEPDEPTAPSLTAEIVKLENRTTYDINLNDKITGSKYKWTSSNTKVAKVNPKNGLVTAVAEGNAIVTCEITLPNGSVQILESIVTVGYDENAPMLTDSVLDLEIGDKYDINVENKIAKSKYRWVSSDRSIVRVNSANGKITAVGKGKAYVTCTITTPENQVIVLRCDINITE